MQIIARPSPNYNDRTVDAVDLLVLHYTGMASCEAALARLCDPAAQVSAHYLIDEDGTVYRLVAEEHRAWHAGVSCWAGERDVNSRSIGIELVNPGHDLGYRNFPYQQMRALALLCRQILSRHPIPASRVLAHSDVAPGRKRDPGEKFDWAWLAGQGVGLWPGLERFPISSGHPPTPIPSPQGGREERAETRNKKLSFEEGGVSPPNAAVPPPPGGEGWGGGLSNDSGYANILQLQQDLARFGYDVPQTGIYGTQTRAAVTAFQRHFRPAAVDGAADAQTRAILAALLAHIV